MRVASFEIDDRPGPVSLLNYLTKEIAFLGIYPDDASQLGFSQADLPFDRDDPESTFDFGGPPGQKFGGDQIGTRVPKHRTRSQRIYTDIVAIAGFVVPSAHR